jgi:hypothetical protein|tara:strand:- start:432 stop:1319 length:888 start_codon:yes stop_codon:yes gene_type:complete
MSTTITNAFITQYESDVHHIFQLEGGFLRPSVRTKSVVGSSTTFQKIAKGTATTKARHGTITPMNQTHTAVSCTLSDFYAGDWADKLDEAKTNIDERMALAKGGAWALGRKVDNQVITVLDTTSESTVTITVTSAAAVRAGLLQVCEALDDNDVPNDGGRYGLLTPRAWSQAMTVKEFNSSDYVGPNGLAFTEGAPLSQKWKSWNNVLWKVHTDLPGKGTATAKVFVYHKNAIGYGYGAHAGNVAENEGVSADITWHGDRASHFVNHMMSGGACLIDTTGVIEGNLNDTTAIATT